MIVEPMLMWMDNQAAMKQLEREKINSRAKLVGIRSKFICHYAQARIVQPSFVKSRNMITDLLMKALPVPRVVELRGMHNLIAL